MADSGGHWATLAQAQKLTQSKRIPGVVETDIYRGNPLDSMPVAQAAASGKSIIWLREDTVDESVVSHIDIGEKLTWSEDLTYSEKETELKRLYVQRKLDQFVKDIYSTYNDYKAQVLLEMEKRLKRKVGKQIIYGDKDYGSAKEFDGLHAWAYERGVSPGGNLNICNADTVAGLSLAYLRDMVDAMKQGCDALLVPFVLRKRINAAYEEKGFAALAYNVAGALASITRGLNDIGKPVLFWDGIPFVGTDYLVAEQEDTGTR